MGRESQVRHDTLTNFGAQRLVVAFWQQALPCFLHACFENATESRIDALLDTALPGRQVCQAQKAVTGHRTPKFLWVASIQSEHRRCFSEVAHGVNPGCREKGAQSPRGAARCTSGKVDRCINKKLSPLWGSCLG